MEWSQEKLNELYMKLQGQAVTDEEFRKALLADPNAVIEEAMGCKLPEGMKFNVIESNSEYNATFVLPDLLGEEIEDDDLNQVAGGFSFVIVASACAAAISFAACAANACAAQATVK